MNDFVLERNLEDVIYALVASPTFATDHVCYAARQSGLYRSDDAGSTWQPAFDSLDVPALPSATAVALSPNFQSDHTLFVAVPGGILSSTDGGLTWMTSALTTPAPFITSLAISPDYSNDGVVLAGSMEDGVFISEDAGSHWNAWNFGLLDQNIFCLALSPDFSRDKRVYVGTESGIYFSKNRGRSWRANNFPADFAPVLSLAVSPTFTLDGMLWAGTEGSGLFYSKDYGASWKNIGSTGSVSNIIVSHNFPENPDILIVLDDELLISRNYDQLWSPIKGSTSSTANFTAVIAPLGVGAGLPLLLGLDKGIVSTTIR